jgi:bacterial/archaeal transporter family-2 protein
VMSNLWVLILMAVVAGILAPLQAAANNRLAVSVDSAMLSALVSFVVGTLTMFAYVVFSGVPLSNLALMKEAPPIALTGGIMGAFFVAATVFLLPRLGVAMTFGLVIAGQMLVTIIIDHFGLLGVPVKEISLARIVGILLIITGTILIRKF